MARTTMVGATALIVATLAASAKAEFFNTYESWEDSATCEGAPSSYSVVIFDGDCTGLYDGVCKNTELGYDVSTRSSCVAAADISEFGPPAEPPGQAWLRMTRYTSDCASDLTDMEYYYYPVKGCVPMHPVYLPGKYRSVESDGVNFRYALNCNSDCSECDNDTTGLLGQCFPNTWASSWSLFTAQSVAVVFKAQVDLIGVVALTSSPAGQRDCVAAIGASAFGGWTLTYDSEEVCCVNRGTFVDGASVTGCDGSTMLTDGFFHDTATGYTYEQCFSDPEPDEGIQAPSVVLATPVHEGAQEAVDVPSSLARDYAVDIDGQKEGAYRLNVGTTDTPAYVYCTGRGKVAAGPTCVMNKCDDATNDFVTAGAATADDYCYHTCFKE